MQRVPTPRLPERLEGRGGLLLRRWRPDDAAALGRAVAESAEHLRPWMRWMALEPQTLAERRAMLTAREREWERGGDVLLGIFAGGRIAGSCGLHRRRGPAVLELGYWIHPGQTRRGLATEAARLLTDAAFAVPGIAYVEVHHDRANVASAGVPRRLGFRFEGTAPDHVTAPAEAGVDCTWRMEQERWRAGAGRRPATSVSSVPEREGLTP